MSRIKWSWRSRRRLRIPLAAGSAILLLGALGLPAGAARESRASTAFDFDTGNAPAEVIYATMEGPERKLISPSGGDATLVLDFAMALELSWFDAIAPYNATAVGVYSNLGRRPPAERTNRNRNIAIFYAAYRMLNNRMPQAAVTWREMMTSVGLDPDDNQENTTTPVGLGNLAAKGVIKARTNDGSNRLGNEGGLKYHQQPYADYTGYKPVNTPYELRDPSRWQPAILPKGNGAFAVQQAATPQMRYAKPITYSDPSQFQLPPPVTNVHNWADYKGQVDEILKASANLTDTQKMTAELFNDKIFSLGVFAGNTGRVAGHLGLEKFVQYVATQETATFDTIVAAWYQKFKYDAVRPFSAVHYVYGDKPVTAWGGPGKGTVHDMPGNEWQSYLQVHDHPDYPSGTASICTSYAQAARLFLGSDKIDAVLQRPAGSSLVEPGITPARDITLKWSTWTDFANDCRLSRYWGGVHFLSTVERSGDFAGQFGTRAYEFIQRHINGSAT